MSRSALRVRTLSLTNLSLTIRMPRAAAAVTVLCAAAEDMPCALATLADPVALVDPGGPPCVCAPPPFTWFLRSCSSSR